MRAQIDNSVRLSAIASILALCFFFAIERAEAQSCDSRTVVVHINGVNTTAVDADQNRNALSLKASRLAPDQTAPWRFRVAYNPTDGLLGDASEALIQLIQNDLRQIGITPSWNTVDSWVRGLVPVPSAYADRINGVVATAVASYSAASIPTQQVTQSFVSTVDSLVDAGNRVLIVPHSQGNLFANELFRKVKSSTRDHIGIVAVASPAAAPMIDPRGYYTTGSEDRVIGMLRVLARSAGLPEPLNATVPNGSLLGDILFGHSFQNYYLGDQANTQTDIVRQMIALANRVPCPSTPTLVTYAFTGTVSFILEPSYLLAAGINTSVGSPVTGQVTYDYSTIRADCRLPNGSVLPDSSCFDGAVKSIVLSIGGVAGSFQLSPGANQASIQRNAAAYGAPASTMFSWRSDARLSSNGQLVSLGLALETSTQQPANINALPSSLPPLSAFDMASQIDIILKPVPTTPSGRWPQLMVTLSALTRQ